MFDRSRPDTAEHGVWRGMKERCSNAEKVGMSEKHLKWFDPKNKHEVSAFPVPTPVVNTAVFTDADYVSFREYLEGRPDLGLLPFFQPFLTMPPAERLKRNLKVALDIICGKTIGTMLRDGVTEKERAALIAIERAQAPVPIRWFAHALLNIEERYQLSLAWEPAFRSLRTP